VSTFPQAGTPGFCGYQPDFGSVLSLPGLIRYLLRVGEQESGQVAMTGSGRLTDRIGIGVLTRLVPRDLIDEILAETGRREKRSRPLPAHVVVYS
jgi:Zn-finger domain-containing protein